jgi:hypothetical protein
MPYLGNIPSTVFSGLSYQDLTGGTGTSFTLDYSVSSAQDIEVFVNNVRQEPGVAYTTAGTTLTMTGSIAATDDFYVVFQAKTFGTVSHPAGNSLQATSGTFSGAVTATSFSGDGSALTGVSAGKLLQVVNATSTTSVSTTSSSFADTGFSASITPSSTSSKILLLGNFTCHSNTNGLIYKLTAYRDGTTNLGHATWGFSWLFGATSTIVGECAVNYLDSPATTSSVTYNIYHAISGSGIGYFTYNGARSGFTLMEISQ